MRVHCPVHCRLLAACVAALVPGLVPAQADAAAPIRVMLRARSGGADRLTPLRYVGGFETKTLLYETLVRRGPDGRIEPALASRWSVDDDGKTFHFQIRDGAKFHDGKPVTADAVCVHFQRWIGLPEHDWLPCNQFLRGVAVESERTFSVTLSQPYSLLADLCAINPCAIVGPGARDWEGEFRRPVGSGPFRFVETLPGEKGWRVQRAEDGGPMIDVMSIPRGRDTTPIDALLAGDIDAFVGGWDEDLPSERLDALATDERFVLQTAPGSSVAYVSFRLDEGPTADLAVRRHIAAAVDRHALIADVEGSRADPCTTWAAPSVAFWPHGRTEDASPAPADAFVPPVKLRLAAGRGNDRASRIAAALKVQLERAGFEVELLARPTPPAEPQSGDARRAANRAIRAQAETADLRVEITHGVPYDPHQTLVARFGPIVPKNEDEPRPRSGIDPRLQALVALAMSTTDELACTQLYAEIQALMDDQALIVPLYSPHRIALRTACVDGIGLSIDVYHVDLTTLHRVSPR